MTEVPEPSGDSEWLADVPSVAEPPPAELSPAEETWPELVQPAPDPVPDRETWPEPVEPAREPEPEGEAWPEPDLPSEPESAEKDDFRRSTFEAQRARRTADSWNHELSQRVARLERRMAAFAHAGQSVDSRPGKPGKEPS
jgi:hypothetical protein